MKPIRSEVNFRPVGMCFALSLLALSAFLSGCILTGPPGKPPAFTLSDAEARKAGALALYSKGLLLEGGEGGDTNKTKVAALEAFRQSLALDPDNRRAIIALISTLAENERFAEALAILETYLARHPEDKELRIEAARFADAADRPADAARHCSAVLRDQPENRELAQALIRLYFQCDQPRQALGVMRDQESRFHDRLSRAVPVHWALQYTREGKHPKRALACLDLAIPQHTNRAERAALISLVSESQLQLGQTNAALATLEKAYRENPAANTPLLRLGTVWATFPDATNRLARQARQSRDPLMTLQVLAATQQALDHDAAAMATLEDVYARSMRAGYFPEEGFYLWLGSLYESAKTYDKAERLFRDALAAHPSSHEIKNFLAYMWAEQGVHLDEALRLINEAMAMMPDNAAYLDTKGWVLFKKARPHDALQLLLKAAELDKDEPVILDHAGDALNAIGRETEAVVFWSRSHKLDPQAAVAEKLRKHGATPAKPAP